MSDRPVRADGLIERQVGDEWMLYDAVGRAVHVLNPSALFVWRRCDGDQDAAAMAAAAAEEFGADEAEASADIEECLARFRELGIVR